jgi:dihydroorotase
MFDLILRGGRVVDANGIHSVDIAISDGRIAARLQPNQEATATTIIEVDDKLLMPGLVDAHVHLREPGMTWKEDFVSGTKAAIAGGVTTVLVMPTDDPWTTGPTEFNIKRLLAEECIYCNVGLQVAVGRDHDGLAELVDLGAVSFEIFTSDVRSDFLHGNAADLTSSIAAVHRAGGNAAVSPGDQSLLEAELARLTQGQSSAADFVRSRPSQAEALGVANAILAAAKAGSAVHIRQCSSREGLATYRRLRDLANVSIETSIQCLLFTQRDYDRLGPLAKASPPWRDEADRQAVRSAVAEGVIDIVVTDHAPHSLDEKMAHEGDFANVPGGFPGVQTLLPTLLHLVDDGLIQLTDLVRLCATRPAELFGLGGQKGRLKVGFDADLLVIDPNQPMTIRHADQISKSKYTPFDGLSVSSSLEKVFVHGKEIMRADGTITDAFGRFTRPG